MLLKKLHEDKAILLSTLALVAFGLVMVYSASSVMAMKQHGDSAYFLKRQLIWAAGGLVAMVVAWKMDYRKYKYLSLPLLVITFVLLVLALAPGIGIERNGARRWIGLGGLSFQPSELAKPAMLLFLSASLVKRSEKLGDFVYGLVPYLIISGTMLFLVVLEPDLGTAAAVGMVVIAMLYVSGARVAHLVFIGIAVLPFLYVKLFHVGFRKRRLSAYIDPWSDPLGTGFQAIQSFLAFGGGGLHGLGLGEGRQKLLFLPEPHSDFIFSVIGEELGLLGAMSVVALFLLLALAGLRLALKCHDGFGRLLALGITLMIGLQALINMGVATGLFPNKGMPLPFISAGGSSLFVALLLLLAAGPPATVDRIAATVNDAAIPESEVRRAMAVLTTSAPSS